MGQVLGSGMWHCPGMENPCSGMLCADRATPPNQLGTGKKLFFQKMLP